MATFNKSVGSMASYPSWQWCSTPWHTT